MDLPLLAETPLPQRCEIIDAYCAHLDRKVRELKLREQFPK